MNAEFSLQPDPRAIMVQILNNAPKGYDHTNKELVEKTIELCGGSQSYVISKGGMDVAAYRMGMEDARRITHTVTFDDPSVQESSLESGFEKEPARRYMALSSQPGAVWIDLSKSREHEEYESAARPLEKTANGCIKSRNQLDRLDHHHNRRRLEGGQIEIPFRSED